MNNPLNRLKYLPWLLLLQVAALTTAIAGAVDILLMLGLIQLDQAGVFSLASVRSPLFDLALSLLIFAAAAGVGALGVVLMERFFSQIVIENSVLWAFVPCLGVTLFLFSQLPVPRLLVGISYPQLIGLVLGIFLKGKRSYRRF
ncbi:MAG: peptide chain release factor 1 [Cyanobacteria bacterium P01_H01_bin.119]